MSNRNLWVCLFDIHFPEIHKPTWSAILSFVAYNREKIAGVIMGGDQMDNREISHWTEGKPLYRPTGSYLKNHVEFQKQVLDPLQEMLLPDTEKIWIEGNHCFWSQMITEKQPELKGLVENHLLLGIEKQGWKFLSLGTGYKLGKLLVIHGETLSGFGNQAPGYHARKAVENYASNVLFGHFHALQMFTKVLPHDVKSKWIGICSPIVGTVNPAYVRNRPSAILNGFTIVETMPGGMFNAFPVVITNGSFSFGGNLYGKASDQSRG